MVHESEILEIGPPIGLDAFFNGKPPKLWCSGEQTLLGGRLLAIISAREMDSDLAARSAELLEQLASMKKEVSFIGGWHSPLEKEALCLLSGHSAQIVFCVAKSLRQFIPPVEINDRVKQGQAFLLTLCSPKVKRISREASIRCNHLVMALASALLILSAPDGSSSLELAKSALCYGKPVLTLEHRLNNQLLAAGALPATLENIQRALE
jgi:predicted Rossmann fold nucleotide-binding protein DprA/Smf involved in DNA uptake